MVCDETKVFPSYHPEKVKLGLTLETDTWTDWLFKYIPARMSPPGTFTPVGAGFKANVATLLGALLPRILTSIIFLVETTLKFAFTLWLLLILTVKELSAGFTVSEDGSSRVQEENSKLLFSTVGVILTIVPLT